MADWAINGLALEGMDDALLEVLKNDGACREKLAYAAGDKKLAAAEPILIGWLKDADAKTKKAIVQLTADSKDIEIFEGL